MPFWRFDIEKVEEHIENDFLLAGWPTARAQVQKTLTRVSKEGIRKQSTTVLIAILSLIQQYINPARQSDVDALDGHPNTNVHTAPCSEHRRRYACTALDTLSVLNAFAVRIRDTGKCDLPYVQRHEDCMIDYALLRGLYQDLDRLASSGNR